MTDPVESLTTDKPLLLIVDDDPMISDTLALSLDSSFEIVSSHSRTHCRQLCRQLKSPPKLALVDLGLPPYPHRPDEGFSLISELISSTPDIRIIVLSGQNGDENARHARTLGAIDFVAKPCDPGELLRHLHRALEFDTFTPSTNTSANASLIGDSPAIQKLRLQLQQYANSPFPILIEGESGSGKEIVATICLHKETHRHGKPFLALNCAAISPSLVEPTLFGYAKGSFTGALSARSGYFEDAGEGTLLLDEIGELPQELQAKLLRVLENGEYQRVGETQTRISRARVIASTNRDLRKEVRQGHFRADLYHRLSVFSVYVPPLRDMGDDRLLLLDHFRHRFAAQTQQPTFALSPEARRLWLDYPFPGNVRELRNIVIRLTAKHAGAEVGLNELKCELDLQDDDLSALTHENASGTGNATNTMLAIAVRRLQQQEPFYLNVLLTETEKNYIESALQLTGGNVAQAARLLGINRTTLYNRMESFSREQ